MTKVTDDAIEEDVVDLEGNKHGTVKLEVNGDHMITVRYTSYISFAIHLYGIRIYHSTLIAHIYMDFI